MTAAPSISAIRRAQERIRDHVHRTPVIPVRIDAPAGTTDLLVKAELFQPGGSFKIRGALNAMLQQDPDSIGNGVVSMSAGNHAIAVAMAAQRVGAPATLVMPKGASRSKVETTLRWGAEVILTDASLEASMHEVRDARGLHLIHPFDDIGVVTGAATAGLELIEDAPHLDAVYVPVGGGGLISGIASAVKALSPSTRVIGVEPEGAAAMRIALESGGDARPEAQSTVADGLKAPYAGVLNQAIVRELVDDMLTVSEHEIAEAFGVLYRTAKLAVEPAAAVGLAGILREADSRSSVATIASGGNVDTAIVTRLLA